MYVVGDCVEQQNVYHVINGRSNEAEQETDDTCRDESVSSFLYQSELINTIIILPHQFLIPLAVVHMGIWAWLNVNTR